VYQSALVYILAKIDLWLMEHKDFPKFENKERQKFNIGMMLGSITMKRRNLS